MSISIELPEDIERSLRQQVVNLDAAARESLLVDSYREKRIGYGQLCRGLGLGRLDVEEVLKRHNVHYDMTLGDVVRESDAIREARISDADRR